ncbi:phosphatidylserine decarboxylase-related protein [Ascobolus immersus RN42]|uniref:Phosphatidylserine decarboxylase-related protein n=1 Tax=Ascobolus immersus RN42 TaxID=1160509 RepID=A0A3N4IFH0_ASCIM|nr:phosphatidylserine decarboxylase-related protein [Ascobolus immersus RN42]
MSTPDVATMSPDDAHCFDPVLAKLRSNTVSSLATHIYSTPGLPEAFKEAISSARRSGIDMHGITSIYTYLHFLERLLTWVPTEQMDGKGVYNILALFYFIVNQPSLAKFQNPIVPSSYGRPKTFLTNWLLDYARAMGAWLDTPQSITPDAIKSFYDSPPYRMQDYIQPEGGWKTFNEFFARELKDGARPIAQGKDVIVAPADAVFDGSWEIGPKGYVTIKDVPWGINDLLDGSSYASRFAGGVFTHSFLNTFDYHRQHTPVSGKVLEVKNIDGYAYFETVVKEETKAGEGNKLVVQRRLEAPDHAGYEFLQMRGLVVVDSEEAGGLVAVLPVGMSHVNSVVMTCQKGDYLKKGDEISYFQFGGSDIVVCYEKSINVEITAEKKHYLMGEAVAKAHPDKKKE